MTGAVLLMLAVSVVLHAGWNLLARHRPGNAPYFMLQMFLIIAAAGLVPFVVGEVMLGSFPVLVWLMVAASGACCALYSFGLTKGYTEADFTVVYPVARALPVLLVGLGDFAFGRYPTSMGWLGMTLVVLGCFLMPLKSFRDFHPSVYFHRSSVWMLLAALGTVGYTLIDKAAAGRMPQGPTSAARYGYLYLTCAGIFYAMLWPFVRRRGASGEHPSWCKALLGGAMIFVGYWLILWAYQLVSQAGYIVAFRQFSIVIGVVLAFIIYKEKGKTVRICGVVLITLGLVVIGIWGH